MANKKILLGMLAIALVFGMTVVGCDDSTDDKNPYVGEWEGTFKKSDDTEVEAKITFTETAWTLTGDSISQTGTYTRGTLQTTLSMEINSLSFPVATCSILLGNLTVNFNGGDLKDGSGSFTRVKENTPANDPFTGTWSGTLKKSGQSDVTVSITFTDASNYSLTIGTTAPPVTGTYEKSNLGLTATLTTMNDAGTFTIGNCLSDPINKNLKLTISGITNYSGYSGALTRPAQ